MLQLSSMVCSGGRDEDRIAILHGDDALLLALADGAGGCAGGAEAAELLCAHVRDVGVASSADWNGVLQQIDAQLLNSASAGECTGLVAEVRGELVRGASVGDSGAWLISGEGIRDLTGSQARKPLLGSGRATVRAFGPVPLKGRLLLASDGLLKYVERDRIAALALEGSLSDAVGVLIRAAQLPNGKLQDDIAVVLCGAQETDRGDFPQEKDGAQVSAFHPKAQPRKGGSQVAQGLLTEIGANLFGGSGPRGSKEALHG
jgi:serine/threonine protein phosphatase PrpC